MIMRFKTKRNTNGNIKYLAFDTEKRQFSRMYPEISDCGSAIEIKARDYNRLRDEVVNKYTEISAM